MKKTTRTIRGYTFDWYSEKELIEIFLPEVKGVIACAIEERSKNYISQREHIKSLLKYVRRNAPEHLWFWEIIADKLLVPDLLEIERHLIRLKRLRALCTTPSVSTTKRENTEEKRDKAKRYPICELARSKLELKPSGKNFIGLCPLHPEKTPSFYLYTATNSFYCFGCSEGGDVINLTMRLYGIDFKDALEMLQ